MAPSLQCSCLENSMGRGAWWATVNGAAKCWTRLRNRNGERILVTFRWQKFLRKNILWKAMFVFRYSYTSVESLAEEPMERSYHLWDYDWTPLSENPAHAEWHVSITGSLIGLRYLVPQHPCWQASPGVPKGAPPCVLGPGSGAESPLPWDTGCSQKDSHPFPHHGAPICREPGAKPFVDDLILVWDTDNGLSSQGCGFPSSHVWMWELDCEESWAPRNWCFWTVVLKKTLESPLDFKEMQPVHSKGDESWCSLEGMMLKLKL